MRDSSSGEPRDLVEIVLQVHGVLRGFAAAGVLVVFLCVLCADDEEVDDGRHDAQSHADLQDEPAMCEAGIRMDRAAGAPRTLSRDPQHRWKMGEMGEIG